MGIDWKMNTEEILQAMCRVLSKELERSPLSAQRNSTPNQQNLDIFMEGHTKRVGQIWPKKTDQKVEFILAKELVEMIKHEVELPEDKNAISGKHPDRCCYSRMEFEKVVEILQALVRKTR